MENIVPQTQETIAAKRARRISERLRESRLPGLVTPGKWGGRLVEFTALIVLVALNYYLTAPLMGTAAVIAPFSGPAIPYLANLLSRIVSLPFIYAVQLVQILFFLFFPVTFYFLISFLTGRKLAAIIAVLTATVPEYFFAKSRLSAGFTGNDGPHIASLGIMPLAIYSLMAFLRFGGRHNLLIAAFLSTAIVLISPFGFLTYLIFAVLAAFSEMLLGHGRLKLLRFLIVFLIAGALAAFWYNPVFAWWMVSGPLGREMRQVLANLIPLSLFIVPVLGAFGFLLFDRKANLQPVFLASFWTIVFVLIAMAGLHGFLSSSSSRYYPELGIALALLAGMATVKINDTLQNRFPWPNMAGLLIAVVLITLIIWMGGKTALPAGEELAQGLDQTAKSHLWLAKDGFDGWSRVIGDLLTFVTLAALVLLEIYPRTGKSLRS